MGLNFSVIKHINLSDEQVEKIVSLKEEHWKYGVPSQKEWLIRNICNDDYHILGYFDGKLIAYSNVVSVDAVTDNGKVCFMGLGNVCIDKCFQKRGFGKELIRFVNGFLEKANRIGLLLCKEKTVAFYGKNGWKELPDLTVFVNGTVFADKVMFYSKKQVLFSKVILNKTF